MSGALLLTVAARELSLHVVLTTALPVAALAVLVFRLLTWDEPNGERGLQDLVRLGEW